jgi:uncharacterized protein (TIGR02453 family)
MAATPVLTDAFLDFFRELTANNTSEWFNANKARYQEVVKKPSELLALAIQDRLRAINPELPLLKASELIFRINRDIRFSKDKSPYKDHVGIVWCVGGKKSELPGWYLHLAPDSAFVAGGLWAPSPAFVKAVRQEIQYNLDEFQALLNAPAFAKAFGTLEGESNKKVPVEFQEDLARQPLLALKQFLMSHKLSNKELTSPKLADKVVESYSAALPMLQFLTRAVKS